MSYTQCFDNTNVRHLYRMLLVELDTTKSIILDQLIKIASSPSYIMSDCSARTYMENSSNISIQNTGNIIPQST